MSSGQFDRTTLKRRTIELSDQFRTLHPLPL